MLVYGKNVIKEAILNQRPIFNLYLDEKFADHKYLAFLQQHQIKIQYLSKGKLNDLTNQALHQGVVANVKDYEFKTLESVLDLNKNQRFLILDELQDPHNLGAILRSAEATNIDGVIISNKNQVQLTATVAKTSAGAIEHVNVIAVSNIHQTILKLKKNNVLIIGTDMKGTTPFNEINHQQSLAIVLGNEGFGIRPLIKNNCDVLVSIPMKGKVNSLNVSVVAGLMLYAIL